VNPTILAVAGVAAMAIIVLALGVALSGRSSISDRLERYAAGNVKAAAATSSSGSGGVAELVANTLPPIRGAGC